MPPLATISDLEARFRPLTVDEVQVAETLIGDASDGLRLRITDIDDRIAEGDLPASIVAAVVVAPVIRYLRNPEGYQSERIGDYSYTRPDGEVTLLFTAEDLARLAPGPQGAFTVRPGYSISRPPQDVWL
jgi:hypothetical protein